MFGFGTLDVLNGTHAVWQWQRNQGAELGAGAGERLEGSWRAAQRHPWRCMLPMPAAHLPPHYIPCPAVDRVELVRLPAGTCAAAAAAIPAPTPAPSGARASNPPAMLLLALLAVPLACLL